MDKGKLDESTIGEGFAVGFIANVITVTLAGAGILRLGFAFTIFMT
jgi:hypothetical protein